MTFHFSYVLRTRAIIMRQHWGTFSFETFFHGIVQAPGQVESNAKLAIREGDARPFK